jgi:ATP-dependent DNA ligase
MVAGKRIEAAFIEPMLLRTEKLQESAEWLYEIKFDGYRAVARRKAALVAASPEARRGRYTSI